MMRLGNERVNEIYKARLSPEKAIKPSCSMFVTIKLFQISLITSSICRKTDIPNLVKCQNETYL